MNTNDMTTDEVRVLKAALDCYTRVLLGQADVVMDPCIALAGCRGGLTETTHERLIDHLMAAREILTGSDKHRTEPSIGNPCISNDARIARRLTAELEGENSPLGLYNRDGTLVR